MYLSFKSIYNKEHMELICNMTYKIPYITVKMIFTRIPYTDKKITGKYSENASLTLRLKETKSAIMNIFRNFLFSF